MRHCGLVLILAAVVAGQDKEFAKARERVGALEAEIRKTIAKAAPGDKLEVRYVSDGKERTGTVLLGER